MRTSRLERGFWAGDSYPMCDIEGPITARPSCGLCRLPDEILIHILLLVQALNARHVDLSMIYLLSRKMINLKWIDCMLVCVRLRAVSLNPVPWPTINSLWPAMEGSVSRSCPRKPHACIV
jgi:hypothetical protein